MTALTDRLELLRNQTGLTGIDFIHVSDDQQTIDVYFHVEPTDLDEPLMATVEPDSVRIESAAGAGTETIPVVAVDWPEAQGRTVMRLSVDEPGGFALYRLTIDDPRIDDHFNARPFSFKVNCFSRLDCRTGPVICDRPGPDGPPADYRARDFTGLRRAMLEAASALEPNWTDRNPADTLIMMTEVLASIGDELAYTQDRFGWEATFGHATQRRSLRRLAQLVDHRLDDGLGASTWLTVRAGGPVGIGPVAAGTRVWTQPETGPSVEFTIGHGLDDELDGVGFVVDHRRNALTPHIFDRGSACAGPGATELAVSGHLGSAFPDPGDTPIMIAIHEQSPNRAQPARTWYVPVISGTDDFDPLAPNPETGVAPAPITRLVWSADHAPRFDFDLTATTVYANVVPATAGTTRRATFSIGPADDTTPAVERTGPNQTIEYLYSLSDPDRLGLVWRPNDDTGIGARPKPGRGRPEVVLRELRPPDPDVRWDWRPTLVGPSASTPDDRHYTLHDGTWGPVARFHRAGATIVHTDWLHGDGFTIGFGDGEFGLAAPRGRRFEAIWRLGNGPSGNVTAGSITHHDGSNPLIVSVTNLAPVTNGTEPETLDDVRRTAPHRWKTITYRAVRVEDHAEALTRLDWVQSAGAATRWTGSWPVIIATADPLGAVAITDEQLEQATAQLDRFRQAGRDTRTGRPHYVDLDLDISVCVDPAHYRGEVIERILVALVGAGGPNGPVHGGGSQTGATHRSTGDQSGAIHGPTGRKRAWFFHPDNFAFATPLIRSSLEATVQQVPGVTAVESITVRRFGHYDWRTLPPVVAVRPDQLIRVVNDGAHPERGTVRIEPKGGL